MNDKKQTKIMSNEEITTLAREYGEFTDMSPLDKKNISAICECFLKFVLHRYCLVEKDKVRGEYLLARADYRTSNGMQTVQEYHRGEMSMIEHLFPEIGKEVEE